jgi:hypothetical protein
VTDTDDMNPYRPHTPGAILLGILLVAAGVALLLERTGALPAPWRLSLWPVLLMGYGVARLTEPRPAGREGTFFVLAGAWWLACAAGWLSFTETWPLLVVAIGASLVVEAMTASGTAHEARRDRWQRRHGAAGWLLPVILIGAVLSSGLDRRVLDPATRAEGDLRAVADMGRRTITVPSTPLTRGDLVVIMGENSLDLRQAAVAPGSTLTITVFGLMGTGIVTVPEGWVVDVQAVPVMGNVSDRRAIDDWSGGRPGPATPDAAGADAAPPRLVLRGTMIMGRLVVRS